MDGVVFRVASTEYTWQDVLDWGHRQEGWSDHVREVREGVAALALARERGGPPQDEVRAAAAAFRRGRRLISAEDTERWLAERRISVAAWMDHICRSLARDRHREQVSGLSPDADGSAAEELALWTTGVCSGLYPAFATALAERAAAAEAWAETGTPGAVPAGDRWDALETASTAFRSAAATDRAVAEEVVARRLDWIDFELEWVSFPEEAMAREALLCLREDGDFSAALFSGDTPAALLSGDTPAALLSGDTPAALFSGDTPAPGPTEPGLAVPGRRRAHLCDFEPEVRPTLIGAQAGDALGPARTAEGWRVTRVLSRRVPAEDDEEVRRLAVAAVQARAVRREVEHRVRWRERH